MYNVLIVDDDQAVLKIFQEALKSFGEFFTPIYATSGEGAVEILQVQDISMLVTDLIMPTEVDGWALIDHVEEKYNDIPVLVISGSDDQNELQRLDGKVRKVCAKPFDINKLVETVLEILNENITSGSLEGISLGSFLQLLEMEGKTCLLEVNTPDGAQGFIYLKEGELYNAVYENSLGREAACRLIGMNNTRFVIKALPQKKIPRKIEESLMSIIMEAMQHKDENGSDEYLIDYHDLAESEIASISDGEQQYVNEEVGECISRLPRKKETDIMVLESLLEDLRSIKGYKAGAIMNYTGEILASDTLDTDVDLANVGAVFNDIFRSSHEAAGKVGLQVCDELTIKTPDGLVIMSCSGVDSPVHFHLIAVLDADGNQALVKLQLDKMTPKVMDELG